MRQLLALYLILTSNITLAGELPNQTKVTPLNSQELGFEIIEVDSGDSETRVFKFKFPATIEDNCHPGRVQTFLTDLNGNGIATISNDYPVHEEYPQILASYAADKYDMAVQVQYCCTQHEFPGCKEAYIVDSVTNYLITRNSNRPPKAAVE